MKQLSIIILSYNTNDLLRDCLKSIYKHLPKNYFEIIVVDNASHDDSPKMIKTEFPHVNLIESDTNLGFAGGINLGVEHAKGEILLLLNSDAQLQNDKIQNMLSFIKNEGKVGIVGGLLLNSDGSPQRSYGSFYGLWQVLIMLIGGDKSEMRNSPAPNLIGGSPSLRKRGEQGSGFFMVDWVSGGFMMMRKKLFDQLHGFDEGFFMYVEDVELCYRARLAGYNVYFYPPAIAVHRHQGSSDRSFAIVEIYKGLLYFYKKHKNGFPYTVLRLILLLKAIILIVFGTITGNRYLKGTYWKALKAIFHFPG